MPELVMQSQGKEAWSNKNWYDKRDSLELRLSFFLILGAGLGDNFLQLDGGGGESFAGSAGAKLWSGGSDGRADFGGLFMTVLWSGRVRSAWAF